LTGDLPSVHALLAKLTPARLPKDQLWGVFINIAALCQAAAPAGFLMSIYANQHVDRSTVLQDSILVASASLAAASC
jgi:hypothetical protein